MAVGLKLAGKNDFVRVQEDINDNLTKLDEAIDFNLLATLGIEYGGILNNTGAKVAGKAYYDTTGKKLYKCVANTNINYADAVFFEALSNNDLLARVKKALTMNDVMLEGYAIEIKRVDFFKDLLPGEKYSDGIFFEKPFLTAPIVLASVDLAVDGENRCFISTANTNNAAFNVALTNTGTKTLLGNSNSITYIAIGKRS